MEAPEPWKIVPTPLSVLLIVAAAVCLTALVMAAVRLRASTRALSRTTSRVRDETRPRIDAINDDVAVAQQELERIQDAMDDLKNRERAGRGP